MTELFIPLAGGEADSAAERERRAALERVAARYAVAITPAMAELIDPLDADDPIARQFSPDPAELATRADEAADPIGDDAHAPLDGIVHRYPDRVLLKPVHACAVYCRFCFRRERVGPGGEMLSRAALDAALAYIAGRPLIWEVILSGGDPLILSPRRLGGLIARLTAIDHVRVLRLHSRVPIVAPDRVGPALLQALRRRGDKALWLVVHANHPREFAPSARSACARLVDAGIPMLGQSVLLRGVNDDADTLGALMRAFVENRIKPYYLHHLDRAPGTAHFRTGIAAGQDLMRRLRGRLSGLCQPTYVLDIPGGHGKTPIGPGYLSGESPDLTVEDFRGCRHPYRDEP